MNRFKNLELVYDFIEEGKEVLAEWVLYMVVNNIPFSFTNGGAIAIETTNCTEWQKDKLLEYEKLNYEQTNKI